MINRAYYANYVSEFLNDDSDRIFGILNKNHGYSSELDQKNAWQPQIEILQNNLIDIAEGYLLIEFAIPRMGKRIDAVLLAKGIVFVLEFKVGAEKILRADKDQCIDYALDLKNFHKASHHQPIIPILVATNSPIFVNKLQPIGDDIYEPLVANSNDLNHVIKTVLRNVSAPILDPIAWTESEYKPTVTIIEAARVLYQKHKVAEISNSEADEIELEATSKALLKIIHQSKARKQKAICFVTGVPGAGKTLIGLDIATLHSTNDDEGQAIYLSGNGPLVKVLREALTRDARALHRSNRSKKSRGVSSQNSGKSGKFGSEFELRKIKRFIQNIHTFRDEYLASKTAPNERVVIFDEAQRSWNLKQTAVFMRRRRSRLQWDKSEPEILIEAMDQHREWAVIICLIGGGQEINTGEAGITEWFEAMGRYFRHWQVFVSDQLNDAEYTQGNDIFQSLAQNQLTRIPLLHLGVGRRSFRTEDVSALVKAVLDIETEEARKLWCNIQEKYPIAITRDLNSARAWILQHTRGTERYGVLASSGAIRLRPRGIDVRSKIEVEDWFLNKESDVRSSYALEQAATEFDIQGLELDWTIVAWDADFRFHKDSWDYKKFKGAKWQSVNDKQRRIYLKNAYRVLLTRARQGMVIFVPQGDPQDPTRVPNFYDQTFEYLEQIGLPVI